MLNQGRYQSFFLNLTYKCPMACKYCYVKQDSIPDMTYEQMDYVVGKILKTRLGGQTTITFFGGEPAIRIDDIEKILDKYYINKETSIQQVRFGIITSFSVNRDKIIRLAKKYPEFEITVSYDDPQNLQRVYKNNKPIDLTTYNFSPLNKYGVCILKVLSGKEKDPAKELQHLIDISIKHNIYADISYNKTPYSDIDHKKLTNGFFEYLSYIEEKLYNEELKYIPLNIGKDIYHMITYEEGRCSGCGMMKEIFISADGTISPCSITNMNRDLQINDLSAYERFIDLESSYFNNDKCRKCDLKKICNGGCMAERYERFGSYNTPDPNWCLFIKDIYNAYTLFFDRLSPDRKQMFIDKCIAATIRFDYVCSHSINYNQTIKDDV